MQDTLLWREHIQPARGAPALLKKNPDNIQITFHTPSIGKSRRLLHMLPGTWLSQSCRNVFPIYGTHTCRAFRDALAVFGLRISEVRPLFLYNYDPLHFRQPKHSNSSHCHCRIEKPFSSHDQPFRCAPYRAQVFSAYGPTAAHLQSFRSLYDKIPRLPFCSFAWSRLSAFCLMITPRGTTLTSSS